MIVVHHLNESRSQRILWMLEELELAYEIKPYKRDAATRLAPPELKEVHPLGKSPVITDGDRVIHESAAIIDYLIRRHANGKLAPDPATPAYDDYQMWLHYAEGSAMLPLMLFMYVMRLGEAGGPLQPRIEGEIANHLGYVDASLEGRPFLVGEDFTGADVQMSFIAEVAKAFGKIGDYPNMAGWLERLHARPAWERALERGGQYNLGR